ncbi:MAG: hypothetical protein HKN94_09155 [Acidimicrobiales bacterium]|nr:hypothetical protein [Acidimicrobiales bacterium]RZV48799.1 MAG: hypothetical protein EX269_00460 [Acidimicrobiales bacterium]
MDRYLSGVNHDEIRSIDIDNEAVVDVRYENHPGTAVPAAPGLQSFWEVSSEGVGTQTLWWDIDAGNWTVVAMNADGSAGVDADLAFGLKIANLGAIAWTVFGFGLISLLLGGFLFYRGIRPPMTVELPPPSQPRPPMVGEPRATDVDLREYIDLDQPPVREQRATS